MQSTNRKQNTPHLFNYKWNLADGYPAPGIPSHKCKVFGTFVCGGGSTMGYKLAGYEHLGGVEIDPKLAEIYKLNHSPEYLYTMDIRDFNAIPNEELPQDLFHLDLLDGSPPCTTFSTAGRREQTWGKEKKFAEGQKVQTLDDLVFVYCDTIGKLRPKIYLLENVAGLVKGNAKSYAKRIAGKLDQIGYTVQVFLLNSATMGVPQARERVFFIGHRKDLKLPFLKLNFHEEPIKFKEIQQDLPGVCDLSDYQKQVWEQRKKSDVDFSSIMQRLEGKNKWFNLQLIHPERVAPTKTTGEFDCLYDQPRTCSEYEIKCVGSFPQDFKYLSRTQLSFLVGMSVPPVMTAQIAYEIYKQWLKE